MSIVSFLIFLLLIGLLIFTHELGHFLVAKANNIRVIEFMIGMGPVIFSYISGGTKYSLRLIPMGGACVMDGMDEINVPKKDTSEEEDDEEEEEDNERYWVDENDGRIKFRQASVWARLATIVAGPLFNFIFAFLLAVIVVGTCPEDLPVIQNVMPGYPMAEKGLMAGDKIVKIDNERIHLSRQIGIITELRNGEPLRITYERDGVRDTVLVIPRYSEEYGRFMLGLEGYAQYEQMKGLQIVRYAGYEVSFAAGAVIKGLRVMLSGHGSKDDLAGPVGMAQIVGEVAESSISYGVVTLIINMVNLTMLLSANLGVMNLLPLPALDGGRLLFILIEIVRGKPLPAEKEGIVHLIGFALLFVLMIFVMFNDITRLFR